ncbi:MAG: hypothetical protein COA44_15665 [Arcobacter sp.]|nr:MAG: hypothetical protein COA44_15665 [Arcobacter sp.]
MHVLANARRVGLELHRRVPGRSRSVTKRSEWSGEIGPFFGKSVARKFIRPSRPRIHLILSALGS